MDANRVYAPRPGLASRRVAGKMVIVNPDTNRVVSLNETGAEVWTRLGDRSVSEVVDELLTLFDVPADVLLADTLEVLGQLERAGLVRRVAT